jgi:hypothetical protein
VRNEKSEALRVEAQSIAEEIATVPDSMRIQGSDNCEKNFTDLGKKYGRDGLIALFSALAHAVCEHCGDSKRDEAGVPDIVHLTDGMTSLRNTHLTYFAPNSIPAKVHQELTGGSGQFTLESSTYSAVRGAQAALDFQLVVTAAHAGYAAMEFKAVTDYVQFPDKVARYNRIRIAILAAVMTRHTR